MTRKLARIARITDIQPIPGADAIECAEVDSGWKAVVKKGEFFPGSVAVYLEVDSWVPHELAPFLSKGHEPREYNGVRGERLRTVKLRGQVSQGLLLNPSDIPLQAFASTNEETGDVYCFAELAWEVGEDVTLDLRVQKYEPPIPAQLSGQIEGAFPSFVSKTDQERCQNLHKEIFIDRPYASYEATMKLDGSSMTVYVKDGKVGVCSRNWELQETDENTLWKVAREQGLIEFLKYESRYNGANLALQGELMGEGIQGNKEKLKGQQFYLYDIFDITEQAYVSPNVRSWAVKSAEQLGITLLHVPILGNVIIGEGQEIHSMESLLAFAEGPSINASQREGVVFKASDGSGFSFKAISNKWLLKHE